MGFQLFIRICTINMSTTVEKSAKPKKATKTTKKADTASAHPPSSTMVVKAIEDLKEKKGSSLAAIKKYIGANYKVDLNQMNVFIRKALKSGIEKKTLVASSGMSGRFKLAKTESKPKPKKVAKKATPSKKKAKKPAARRQHPKRLKKQSRRKQPNQRNQWQRKRRKSLLQKRLRQRKNSDQKLIFTGPFQDH